MAEKIFEYSPEALSNIPGVSIKEPAVGEGQGTIDLLTIASILDYKERHLLFTFADVGGKVAMERTKEKVTVYFLDPQFDPNSKLISWTAAEVVFRAGGTVSKHLSLLTEDGLKTVPDVVKRAAGLLPPAAE